MSVQSIHVFSNEFKINNVKAVLDVLSEHNSSLDLEVVLDANGEPSSSYVLASIVDDPALDEWPGAIKDDLFWEEYADDLPEEFLDCEEPSDDDMETFFTVLFEARAKHGDEGFVKMLSALSPYLLTPLTIHALRIEYGEVDPAAACGWHVRPGDEAVDVSRFLPSPPTLAVSG